MTEAMKSVLTDVSFLDDVTVVAISGRKTEDVQSRIGLSNIMYCGNFGLEMCLTGNGMTYNVNAEELR